MIKLFKTDSIMRFFNKYDEHLEKETFNLYISRIAEQKDLKPAHIIKNSDIDRVFGYQIFNGKKKPSRDNVIKLAFGFEMNVEETQLLLKKARKCALSPKIKRDAAVLHIINENLGMRALQTMLFELGLHLLGDGKYDE